MATKVRIQIPYFGLLVGLTDEGFDVHVDDEGSPFVKDLKKDPPPTYSWSDNVDGMEEIAQESAAFLAFVVEKVPDEYGPIAMKGNWAVYDAAFQYWLETKPLRDDEAANRDDAPPSVEQIRMLKAVGGTDEEAQDMTAAGTTAEILRRGLLLIADGKAPGA